jgi:hypothetical protein
MDAEQSEKRVNQLARWRAEGEAMVAAWQASGLSMRAYAQQAGISERRLGLWRRRLASEDDTSGADSSGAFVPVSVMSPTDGIEVLVGDDVRIVVTAATDLSLLRQAVAAQRC